MGSDSLDKGYEPAGIEEKWYQFWQDNGFFKAEDTSDKPPFSIVIPPPNVTGVLHMGHALNNVIQDIMCRYRRLLGYNVLWMPGTDHAGIATQNVVERDLAARGKIGISWAGKPLSKRSGNGRKSPAAPSSTSSSGWGPPVTGTGSGSPWMRGCRMRCARCLSGFTKKG